MNNVSLPAPLTWVEASILVSLVGALCVVWIRDAQHAARWCIAFASVSVACTLAAAVGFFATGTRYPAEAWSLQLLVLDRQVLDMDAINAPLLPSVALLHLLTALATPRTKMPRFSFAGLLGFGAIRLATFAAVDPWVLVGLLAIGTIPPYIELLNRGKPTRVYLIHMGLYVSLLILGWGLVELSPTLEPGALTVPLLLAILVRSGSVPTHCWLTDVFEHGTFGMAILVAVPITGVYAAIRLVMPVAPLWVMHTLGLISLATAVYASGMALVQREARRFFAFVFLSHASLVLVGLEQVTSISLTGALCLWFSIVLSLGGLGLSLRALEARYGRLSLTKYHGLYRHSPSLAIFFLLTGLASVGFPGTLGFVSADLLVEGVIEANPYVGFAVVVAGALNGIAVVRAYLLLFTGTQHTASVPLNVTLRERIAVLTLAALILGGGLYPQPGVTARHNAAEAILKLRQERFPSAEQAK